MGRHVLAAVVVLVDTGLLIGAHSGDLSPWAGFGYALIVTLVVALRYRMPVAAFVAALVLSSLTGVAYVLLLWAAYQAGREVLARSDTVVVAGATFGAMAAQLAIGPVDARGIPNIITVYVVFVALPMLAGRYLAQHERLVSTLSRHNRQLRWKRELLAEQERLRERLRIARDMHDSLGRRLSLVSIQAAALEVTALPPRQRQAVRQLAAAGRGAMEELYEVVGALREGTEPSGRTPGVDAIADVVADFRAAGVPVTLNRRGEPGPLSAGADQAAYRVVEEGLTNAAKHAPGQPVTVSVEWEPDALLVTVANPLSDRSSSGGGHGLCGLSERVRPAGGFLDHRSAGGSFRLVAMLPVLAGETGAADAAFFDADAALDAGDGELPAVGRIRTAALGVGIAALMFIVLPASMLVGVA